MKGLDSLHPPNLSTSSLFRLQTFRTNHLLDQVPNQDVSKYAELLLAEREAAALSEDSKKQKVAHAGRWGVQGEGC